MALTTPTTKSISDNIVAQIESTTSQTVPLLPKSFIRVLSRALAGVFIILYKFAGFNFLQQFVSTASDKPVTINGVTVTPLTEWGNLVGVGAPVAASQAQLSVTVTVLQQVGVLPSNSQLIGSKNGVVYITTADVTLDAATKLVTVRAVSDQAGGDGSGEIGNLVVADKLAFANPLPNVDREVTVDSVVLNGVEAESTESYRQRIINRFSSRPQGGAPADYQAWGTSVAGVQNIYPYKDPVDPGVVQVYIEATTAYEPDGLADAGLIASVLTAINLDVGGIASRRQVGALVEGYSITRVSFDLVVYDLTSPNSLAALQTNLTNALQSYFLEREPYIAGLSTGTVAKDVITTNDLIAVIQPIVAADGGSYSNITFEITGAGSTITVYSLDIGEKAKANSVSYN